MHVYVFKGSVRAMDAIQEFILEENGNQISKFMVAGESKVNVVISNTLLFLLNVPSSTLKNC